MDIKREYLEVKGVRYSWSNIQFKFNRDTWKLETWGSGNCLDKRDFSCMDTDVPLLFAGARVNALSVLFPQTDKDLSNLRRHNFRMKGVYLTPPRKFDYVLFILRILCCVSVYFGVWSFVPMQLWFELRRFMSAYADNHHGSIYFDKDRIIVDCVTSISVFTWEDVRFIPDLINKEWVLGVTGAPMIQKIYCDEYSMECIYGEYLKHSPEREWECWQSML